VLMAGTNDVGNQLPIEGVETSAARIAAGIEVLLRAVRAKAPGATVILMGIPPRADNPAVMPVINGINQRIAPLADGQVVYLNINDRFVDASDRLLPDLMQPDQLHLALPGYRTWAEALQPLLTGLLGPRALQDRAPPPTGNPAAGR
jgi:lysophospholipase L1-like esterase